MKEGLQPEQQPSVPARRRVRNWLLGILITLLLLVFTTYLLVPQLIDSVRVKQKIQAIVAEQAGGQIDYQSLAFSCWPRPSIELQQLTLTIPARVQGRIEALQISPELLLLLTGTLKLARLKFVSPEFNLDLPAQKVSTEPDASSSVEKVFATALGPLASISSDLKLHINNGRLSITRTGQKLVDVEGLTLQLALSVKDPHSADVKLHGEIPELTLQRNGRRESIKDLIVDGSARMAPGEMTVLLERLATSKPALELTGRLALAPTSPALSLKLSGRNIDVDATRDLFLALAGELSPGKEIFDYLRGGLLSQLNITSQGEQPSDLGNLKNLLITGHLQDGKVAIPEIELDLTAVNGDFEIRDGVLQGTRMSTRLEGTTGHDGTLTLALAKGPDLFQLELILKADLAQAQSILKRVVKSPDFDKEIDKITRLQGAAVGKLMLGDSLADIKARIDLTELNLTADYQGLPYPIGLTNGLVDFVENRVVLKDLNGTFGRSEFSGVACSLVWEDALQLDLSSGQFTLELDELYPWLVSFEGVKETLREIKQLTGRIALTSLAFKGTTDKPEEWQIAATGSVKSLNIETPRFPATISLAVGDFNLDAEKLSFQNLQLEGLDAALVLSGNLKGLPRSLKQIELSLDGKLGKDSVAWLRENLEVPAGYNLRTPLTFSNAELTWQSESSATFKGSVAIEKGPQLTLDVNYQPEQLSVNSLIIKDKYSNVELAYGRGQQGLNLKFRGTLQNASLEALFIDQAFAQGKLEGDFDVKMPLAKSAVSMTRGLLQGSGLLFHTPSGDKVAVEKISLVGDGAQVKAEATTLSWNDLIWNPLKATIDFDQDKINARFTEAKLCGIDSSGLVSLDGKELGLDLKLDGKGLDVATSYSCLTKGEVKMSGALDFFSKLTARGEAEELVGKLQGPLEMTFSKGSIEQSKLLARILEVLNVTEIVKGRLPDLTSSGFAYTTMTLNGEFRDGRLFIEKLAMDGETLDVIGSGEIDLMQETINLELLAAPFKTVDTVVKNIPGVNYLLAGSLVTIPVSIIGPLKDPKVEIMSVASVGSGLLRLGERTIKSPLKLIETFMPGGKK
jgi:hypothetical protein